MIFNSLLSLPFSLVSDHTGIEISGVEYSFAGGPEAGSGTGVMTQRPRDTPADGQWKFKQAIILGTTDIPYKDFDKTLQELKDAFPANTYDLVRRPFELNRLELRNLAVLTENNISTIFGIFTSFHRSIVIATISPLA